MNKTMTQTTPTHLHLNHRHFHFHIRIAHHLLLLIRRNGVTRIKTPLVLFHLLRLAFLYRFRII